MGNHLPRYKDIQQSPWRGPCGKEQRIPANSQSHCARQVSTSSWKWNLWPQSSLQMSVTSADTFTVTSQETLSQNHLSQILDSCNLWDDNVHCYITLLSLGLICCVVIGKEHTTTPFKFTRFLYFLLPCISSQAMLYRAIHHSSCHLRPNIPETAFISTGHTQPLGPSSQGQATPQTHLPIPSEPAAEATHPSQPWEWIIYIFFFHSIFFLIIKVIHINYRNLEISEIYLNGSLNNP